MELAAGWRVAFGRSSVVEYLLATDTIRVPRTPGNCAGLLVWRARMIPVLDFGPLLSQQVTRSTARAVILAYQDAPARPLSYGALLVTGAPTELSVSDDAMGSLGQVPEVLRQFARACFLEQDKLIPILDTRELFTRPLRPPGWSSVEAGGRIADAGDDLVRHDKPVAEDAGLDHAIVESIRVCRTLGPEAADQELAS